MKTQAKIEDEIRDLEKSYPEYLNILKKNSGYSISDKIGFDLAKALLTRERIFLKKAELKGITEGKKLAVDDEISFLEQLKEVRGYSKTYLAKKIDIRLQKLNKLKEQK